MGKYKVVLSGCLATWIAVLASGCGQETVRIPDTTRPMVTSTIPANGATGVPFDQVVSATFSKAMNPTTLNSASFTLTSGGAAVAGTVSYTATGSVASFTPTASLTPGTLYTATITTSAADTAVPANTLAANYIWTFTTALPVAVPPTVIATVAANGATGVSPTQPLTATFSKAMNPTTINGTTFTLQGPAGVAVAGTVTYAGTSATFTPATGLAPGTLYTATITTGAQDVAGDALAANYVWTFTTAAIPPTVIATIPVNGATGVSVKATVSAVFSKAMNPATINATTFTLAAPGGLPVTGSVTYAGTTATFLPGANLATNTLYTATITSGAQDVAGDALAANYVWMFKTGAALSPPTVIATNPINNATGVPINQAVTATFNEAVNPLTVTTATFKLSAPGGVAVAGTVAYDPAGSVATFTPTTLLAANTLFTATITTGVMDLSGTALAANYVWTFTTGAAPDTTPPTVFCTDPGSNATGVPVNQELYACFSEAIDPSSINSTTFTLATGGTAVAGMVAYTMGDASFTPASTLAFDTVYTATLTTGVKDLSGNALASNYMWSFTTGSAPDTTDPTIVLTNPLANATGVALNQTVNATFSEEMDPSTISTATFTLSPPVGPAVVATVTYDPASFIASLAPTAPLIANTTYTAVVTTGATDLSGNPLGAGVSPNPWTFTTGVSVLPPIAPLGTAAVFGGLGSVGMTNMGISTIVNGNIGTTGVSTTITGFHDTTANCVYTETLLNVGLVNGTIDTAPPPPTVGCPGEGTAATSAAAAQAALDAGVAYADLAALTGGMDVSTCAGCGGGSAGELGSRTLAPGIYKSAPGSFAITLGDLTLDAKGDPNASWVFQMSTTLTVGTPSVNRSLILTNGASAKNVFWQVGTAATINGILGGGTMAGTVIAQSGISVSTAGVNAITTVNGRLLALVGPVTLVNTVINVPAP